MRKVLSGLILGMLAVSSYAQEGLVSIEPATAIGDDEIRVIYDATLGETALVEAEKVYMHSGVITDGPDGEDWQFVIGNWGADDGIGEMTPVDGETDKWEITLSPTARDYYGVPDGTNIFRLSMVFRSPDGSDKGAGTPGSYSWGTVGSNGDIYVNLDVQSYVQITSPTESALFIEDGETVEFAAEASSDVTSMRMLLDTGSGYTEVASVASGTVIDYTYDPDASGDVHVRIEAEIGGESVDTEKTFVINLRGDTNEAALPAGVVKGINYIDDNTVILVLEAPFKDFVYVVGDFNNWQLTNEYLMFKDPSSDLFWLEVDNLTAGQKYVFQYWVDGTIRIGDPYADEVADADNDPFIPASVHPDIAPYSQSYGPASVLQTAQSEFNWNSSEDSWVRPDQENLIVYELLLRDFLETHSYDDLIDTLGYLKRLGVNAIELMPVMEFEGNISWGYNPSYFFAVDKYYGTKNDFKRFVQAAHAEGMAVIMDMVLNHAFGQNSLVQMYFSNGRPTPESPWFNQEATHPFNVGYDFNHESLYTQDFVDSVNTYWLEEYHIDGYRFDLSKGFTQTVSGSDVGLWSSYDASRIALLKRMAGEIWAHSPDSYVILEHFAEGSEEAELAAEGMILWRNMNFTSWESLANGNGDFTGANAYTHVSYMESHDEERISFEALLNGANGSNGYNTRDTTILLERHKMNAAFFFLLRGPKMLWQFGELGYDIELNDDRLAQKPLPWGAGNLGYYEDELRQYLYSAYARVLDLRQDMIDEINSGSQSFDLSGDVRFLTYDGATDLVVAGNFGLSPAEVTLDFTQPGTWYDYFSGEEVEIIDLNSTFTYQPGEFHIYTSVRKSDGFPDVIEVFDPPVSVAPDPFTKVDEITIRFDATKASTAGTSGLVGVDKVFMYSGVVIESPSGTVLENIADGPEGEMTRVAGEDDVWEITLTPSEYYSLASETEIFRLGMYFRNETGDALGKGFRDQTIYLSVLQEGDIISVAPSTFGKNDQITITFDARFGGGELFGAGKVYMHSGVVLSDIAMPTGNDWDNVVGDWGQDNGVGEMTRVPGESDKWEITLTPSAYYSLATGEIAYWLSMVFRNADGSTQATITAGNYDAYYVAENSDLFYAVPDTEEEIVSLEDDLREGVVLYPNPAASKAIILSENPLMEIQLSDISGRVIRSINPAQEKRAEVDISGLANGWYYVKIIDQNGRQIVRKLVVGR